VKDELLPVHYKGMTRVVPPLEANDIVCLFGQQIDNLSLTFISPLGSNHHYIGHAILFLWLGGTHQ
jgi:hypothetical protein